MISVNDPEYGLQVGSVPINDFQQAWLDALKDNMDTLSTHSNSCFLWAVTADPPISKNSCCVQELASSAQDIVCTSWAGFAMAGPSVQLCITGTFPACPTLRPCELLCNTIWQMWVLTSWLRCSMAKSSSQDLYSSMPSSVVRTSCGRSIRHGSPRCKTDSTAVAQLLSVILPVRRRESHGGLWEAGGWKHVKMAGALLVSPAPPLSPLATAQGHL